MERDHTVCPLDVARGPDLGNGVVGLDITSWRTDVLSQQLHALQRSNNIRHSYYDKRQPLKTEQ